MRDKLRHQTDEAAQLERLRDLIDLTQTAELRERMIAALRHIDPQTAAKIVGPSRMLQ